MEVINVGVSDQNCLDIEVIPQEVDSIPDGVYLFGLNYSAEIQAPSHNSRSILRLEASDISTKYLHQISIFIENLSMEHQGLLACVISLQTGTSISQNELERLKRRRYFDYFEVRKHGSEVILFWRGIEAAGKKEFKIWYREDFEVKDPNPILVEAFLCYNQNGSKVKKMVSLL